MNKFLKVVNARRGSATPSEAKFLLVLENAKKFESFNCVSHDLHGVNWCQEVVVPKVEFEAIQEQPKRRFLVFLRVAKSKKVSPVFCWGAVRSMLESLSICALILSYFELLR